jgi:glycerate kinase
MKRIVVATGAFKHSLTVLDALDAVNQGVIDAGGGWDVVSVPMADGGNGTLEAFLSRGGRSIDVVVHDPLMRKINSRYGLIHDGKIGVIEMALASGLELLTEDERAPLTATTYGTGELMRCALEQGVHQLIVGVGGSATNDGGCGALSALGVKFFDANDQLLDVRPDNMLSIKRIDLNSVRERWSKIDLIIGADVDNPVLGERGASVVFAPQKGATDQDIAYLDESLDHYFGLLAEQTGVDVRYVEGAGAAGALAGALMAVLGARIESGVELLMRTIGFAEIIQDADYVITSEGKLDHQTLGGKVVLGVAKIAKQYHIPCIVFVGHLSVDESELRQYGISAVIPIIDRPMRLNEALENAKDLLKKATRRTLWLLTLIE